MVSTIPHPVQRGGGGNVVVTFDANGGEFVSAPETPENPDPPKNDPGTSGSGNDADGSDIDDPDLAGGESSSETANITAYADNTSPTTTVTVGQTYGAGGDFPEVTRQGYEFLYWSLGKDTGNLITENSIVSEENPHTLYARWARQQIAAPADHANAAAQYDNGTNPSEYGTFEEMWKKAAANGGTVTLLDNVTATNGSFGEGVGFSAESEAGAGDGGYILVPAGKEITLNLNGHTLDRALTTATPFGHVINVGDIYDNTITTPTTPTKLTLEDCSTGGGTITGGNHLDDYFSNSSGRGVGVTVDYYATFIMDGGTISGNTARIGGGVCNWGTFTMNGGTIISTTASTGGGVYNMGSSAYHAVTFTMNGGTITSNTANTGGGIYVNGKDGLSIFSVSGSPDIFGNHITNNSAKRSNVYLARDSNPVTLTAALSPDAKIGVATEQLPSNGNPVTVGAGSDEAPGYTPNESDRSKFTSDEDYRVELTPDNKIVLTTDNFAVTYHWNDGSGKLQSQPYPSDGSGTLAYIADPEREGYAFDGWFDKESGGVKVDAGIEVTRNLDLYAHWTKTSPDDPEQVKVTIQFGGTALELDVTKDSTYGEILDEILKNGNFPGKEGYTLSGLSASENGDPLDPEATVAKDTVVYPVWKPTSTPSNPSRPSRPNGGSSGSSGGSSGSSGGSGGSGGGSSSGSGSSTLTIVASVTGSGGSISPGGRTEATRGSSKTYSITPQTGYVISDVLVDGKSVGAVSSYTFTNIQSSHTIRAIFKPSASTPATTQPAATVTAPATASACPKDAACPLTAFGDASPAAWYHDGVHACLSSGLMAGTGNGLFEPLLPLSRGMLAQILYNYEGKPAVGSGGSFPDVASGAWYENAVKRASASGIVAGYANGNFGPNDPITREQLVVVLWRRAGSPIPANSIPFIDYNDIREYARDAVRWAYGSGIVTGKEGNRFDPNGPASRAEVAQMLRSYLNL